jgi:hypothetical protein
MNHAVSSGKKSADVRLLLAKRRGVRKLGHD